MTEETLIVNINQLADDQISVDIEVPAHRCKASYESALVALSSSIRLPGFRPGKVPKAIIVQRMGMARIKASALENLINNAWEEVITSESINPVSEAKLKEELQSLVDRFNPNQNVSFTLEAKVDRKENND